MGSVQNTLALPLNERVLGPFQRFAATASAGGIVLLACTVVAFLVLPIFALANAGVPLKSGGLGNSIALGIILGLVIGKPLGITFASWLVVRLGVADLPAGVRWRTLHGAAWLGGIGFTMSIFISGLAFRDAAHHDIAKLGILTASLVAGITGWILLRGTTGPAHTVPDGQRQSLNRAGP